MEITAYIVYSVLCFLVFLMGNNLQFKDNKLLRWLAFPLFIGLGVSSLKLEYQFALSNQIDMRYLNSNDWQVALLVVYSFIGLYSFLMATLDQLDENERLK